MMLCHDEPGTRLRAAGAPGNTRSRQGLSSLERMPDDEDTCARPATGWVVQRPTRNAILFLKPQKRDERVFLELFRQLS